MFLLVLVLTFVGIYSMPYNVPLQGESGGKRTLVLLDDLAKKFTYSMFFDDLSARGHDLRYFRANADDLVLKVYGEYLYDNIIFFAPAAQQFHEISFDDITEFVQTGGNLLLAADKYASEQVRDFIEGFGAVFDKKGTEMIDHFKRVIDFENSLDSSVFQASEGIDSSVILGDLNGKLETNPVLYRGVGHKISSENTLAAKVLRGNPTTYSRAPGQLSTDTSMSLLVSAIQGRNNARVVISGSLELFSNSFFNFKFPTKDLSGNRKFCQSISSWNFRESGILRFRNITHHKVDGTPPDVILHEKERPDLPISLFPDPEITRNSLVYRIKDEIVYSMIVEEYNHGVWRPFSADDMQLEFVMLDPYIRKTMSCDSSGKFTGAFVAPDSYGIFKFRVLYRRIGYSVIHAETQVSIRDRKSVV